METKSRKVDAVALRKVMIEKGFKTIVSLATASGVHRNVLGQVLNEQILPSSDAICKLATTLELSDTEVGRIFFARILRHTQEYESLVHNEEVQTHEGGPE